MSFHLLHVNIPFFLFVFLGRRNPFRMLSNAIDFRNRRKVQRPKSADQERGGGGICANPSGGNTVSYYLVKARVPPESQVWKCHGF